MLRSLKPIYDFDSYSIPIAKEIYKVLVESIYTPLLNQMKPFERLNAKSLLAETLRSGKLQFVDGFFYGPLNATLSRELRGIGARYNKTRKAYQLDLSNLPQDIVIAISEGNQRSKAMLQKVQDFLKAIEERAIKVPDISSQYHKVLEGLAKQFRSTTKVVTGKDIEIPFRKELVEKLKDSYTENLGLYIQKWHDEAVLRLRQEVSKNAQAGFRAENLIKTIQAEKKISYNKAKFLAKQETSLMVSKYRQLRYESIGVNYYMWSTSRDARVRHSHRELQGKIFRFDQPPVTDLHTMARNNPGMDYNCRCIAIPILKNSLNMKELEVVK